MSPTEITVEGTLKRDGTLELDGIVTTKGFALAMMKMPFAGELQDVVDTVAANWRSV